MNDVPMIIITGPDGSGKSTACAALAKLLEKRRGANTVACASVWDAMLGTGAFSREQVTSYLATLGGPARTLFIFHAMLHSLELARSKHPSLILVDGFFYKYAATELAKGTPPEIVAGAARAFAKPTLTLFLEVDAQAALSRKPELSRYEGGSPERFLELQRATQAPWAQIEREHGPWTHVPTDGGAETTAQALLARVMEKGLA